MDRVQLEFKGDSVTKTIWEKRLELVDISLDCILSQQLLLNQRVAARTDSSIHLSYHKTNASEQTASVSFRCFQSAISDDISTAPEVHAALESNCHQQIVLFIRISINGHCEDGCVGV